MNLRRSLIIDANDSGWKHLWRDLYDFRELFWVFAYRDFKVRYAQTMIGLLWGIIQPVITLSIFIVIFQFAVKIDSGRVPYPLMSLIGLGAWSYFAFVLRESGSALINASHIVKKIYFPRLILPVSKILIGLIEWSIVWVFIAIMLIYYQITPPIQVIIFPVIVLLTTIFGLGAGLWLSALTIKFRDFQHLIPFLTQIGIYLSPVAYPSNLIPPAYQCYYYLNPVAGVIDLLRWCITDSTLNPMIGLSIITGSLVFLTGFYYFCRVERKMADHL
jgi:lipopolysaccharide transport system permease protein